MMKEGPSPEDQLRQKYPDMKPVKRAPTLFSLNGFGLSLAGSRRKDLQLETLVKSHVITLLFIPVFTLGSYVVTPAENGGYYFLGKVGKGSFARFWNTFLIIALAGFISLGWWKAKQNSPEAIAKRKIAEAQAEAEAGRPIIAANLYLAHLNSGLPMQDEAREGLKENFKSGINSDQPGKISTALQIMTRSPGFRNQNQKFYSEMSALALERAKHFSESNPAASLEVIERLDRLSAKNLDLEDLNTQRHQLLLTLTEAQPDNPGLASKLAVILENEEKYEEAFALLNTHVDRLEDLEGSRILGQLMLGQGSPEIAAKLLDNYTKPRIKKWKDAEVRYNNHLETAYNRILAELNSNQGPASFYKEWEDATSENEKSEIVDSHIYGEIKKQPSFISTLEAYEGSSAIVPVIMDLGISELQSAQSTDDPSKREELLQSAEDRFLSLQASSGNSAQYKFFLGQVYFWSGRQEEGRKLFDEILADSDRSFENLLTLAETLREIGNTTEAKKLAEEAFNKTGVLPERKSDAASLMALMADDLDEKISWLEKITNKDLATKTRLAETKGHQLANEGKTKEAIQNFKEAAEGWANLPLTSSTMNNGALVESALFNLTGDISHHEKGSEFMERAVKLEGNNSIVLGNASSFLLSTSVMQVIGDKIHPRLIQEGVGVGSLRLLYRDEKSRQPLLDELRTNSNFIKALEFLDRAILLAPNNRSHYATALSLHSYLKNEEGLKSLARRMEAAQLDNSEQIAAMKEFISGADDTEIRESQKTGLEYQQKLLTEISDNIAKQQIIANMVDSRLSLFSVGDPVDYDTEIALLGDAMKIAPSTRIQSSLKKAHLQKACESLANENPDLKKLVESSRRFTDAESILALGLTSDSLRPAILANPVAQKSFQIATEFENHFPKTPEPSIIVYALYASPSQYESAKAIYEQNAIADLSIKAHNSLTAWHPSNMVSTAIHHFALGDTETAKTLIDEAREHGLYLPN